ncbi:MAG TPA: MBL fold metallo-hydrolase [Pyrinomonadaceae bacterium]|nr:MBL fold metallo-hydrolase [Pyrinomonadaceae bacterium]
MSSFGNLSQEPTPLRAVDQVRVLVLIDNVSDQLSTNPDGVLSEYDCLLQAGMTALGGDTICCPHFGLSLSITTQIDGKPHTVLFDGGPEGEVLERNARLLGVDFGAFESVVLSHGHFDHAAGLPRALQLIQSNRGHNVPLWVHPEMFRPRGDQLPDGNVIPNKDIPGIEALTLKGAEVVCTRDAQLLLEDTFYISGEIFRVTTYEKGLPGHMRRTEDELAWEPDPLIPDERFLAVKVREKGVVVFTACSHAGVVNVLEHASAVFPNTPLYAVMGGLHLSGAGPEKIISETVRDLKSFGLKIIVPAHCTGWRAVTELVNTFGEHMVIPSAVGKLFTF